MDSLGKIVYYFHIFSFFSASFQS